MGEMASKPPLPADAFAFDLMLGHGLPPERGFVDGWLGQTPLGAVQGEARFGPLWGRLL